MKKILLILLLLSCVSCSKTEIKEIEKPKEAFNSPFWYVSVETSATSDVYNEVTSFANYLSLLGCSSLTGNELAPFYSATAKIGNNFTLYRAIYKIPVSVKSVFTSFQYRVTYQTESQIAPVFAIPKYNLFNCYSLSLTIAQMPSAYKYIIPTTVSCTYDEIKNEITDVYQKLD